MMKVLNKLRQEPVFFLFNKMWRFAKGHRHLIVIFWLMFVLSNIVLLIEPLVIAELLNEIQHNGFGDHNLKYILLIILSFIGIELAFWLFHGPARVIENLAAFRTERNYRQYLLSGTLGLNLSWHSGSDSGDTIDKINKATDGLYRFSWSNFKVIGVIIKAIGTTGIVMFFNIYIGLLAFAILIFAFFIIFQFDLRLIPQYKKLNEFDNEISARIFDGLSNITTVKVLHIEKPVFDGIKKTLWAPFTLFRKNIVLGETKWFVGSVLFAFLIVLPLGLYVLYLYRNNLIIEIGTISALYLYLSRLNEVYFTFASQYEEMIVNKTRIINAERIESAFDNRTKANRTEIDHWQTIDLSEIFFKYEDIDQQIHHIDNMSFSFFHGEKIALIGESGSGKTTFLKILHGMYPNATARISVDSQGSYQTNFADIDLKTTLVPQEPEIFSASIRENITLGIDYTNDQISQATDMAEFSHVVKQLPNGLESKINEKGVNLSGGQKQRLALARALLFSNDKEIILLDESTSSVDPETENKIYKNIFHLFKDKTVLASVHKMNLLKYFDRIVILSNGKIIDQGTFEELLMKNEKFQQDWQEFIDQQNKRV